MWPVIHRRSLHFREPNEVRILRLVRDRQALSRIELSRATGLHKATVSGLVAKLIKAGFLQDTGEVETRQRVGRKRALLRFLPLAGLVIGVDIRRTGATVAITDLNAHVLQQNSFSYHQRNSADQVMSRVVAIIRQLLKRGRHPRTQLVGIGVGVQGIVDYSNNTLVLSQNKKAWEGESLGTRLEREFGVPVYVENDVKSMALGEYLLGAAKGSRHFVYIWVGEGVGAGIIVNGQLLRGITSSAGEIGYNSLEFSAVDKARFPFTFRGQEMFGQILTDANLIESYRRNSKDAAENLTVPSITEKAALGDSIAQQVIEEFISLLSIPCIMMLNTLNPEMIIVGGQLSQSYPAVAEQLQRRIHRDLLAPPAEAVRIRCAANGDRGVILGAAGLVLHDLFEPLQRGSRRTSQRHSAVG